MNLISFKYKFNITPPNSLRIPITLWNLSAMKEYYKLRRSVLEMKQSGVLQKEIPKLPINVWILIHYMFEVLFISFHLVSFTIYLLKVPVYRGMIPFYMGLFFLSYFIFSYKMIFFNIKVLRRINIIIKILGEY